MTARKSSQKELGPAWAPSSDWKPLYQSRQYQDARGKTLRYRMMLPPGYNPRKKYPLVLLLHGAGERGDDNAAQLFHGAEQFAAVRDQHPAFVVVPQCPASQQWVAVSWGAAAHSQPSEPSEPMRLTLELLQSLRKEFSIDARRLYITGLSMGGYGAWDAIARHPDLFAAAVPICGGGDEAAAPAIAKLPIWAFHGLADDAVPVERSRSMIAAIKKAGGAPKYTEYPGVGHNSWTPAYQDGEMMKWLFSQKRPG